MLQNGQNQSIKEPSTYADFIKSTGDDLGLSVS